MISLKWLEDRTAVVKIIGHIGFVKRAAEWNGRQRPEYFSNVDGSAVDVHRSTIGIDIIPSGEHAKMQVIVAALTDESRRPAPSRRYISERLFCCGRRHIGARELSRFYLRHMYLHTPANLPWAHGSRGFQSLHLTPDYWESGTQLRSTSFNGMSWLRDARHIISLTANHTPTCLGSPAARTKSGRIRSSSFLMCQTGLRLNVLIKQTLEGLHRLLEPEKLTFSVHQDPSSFGHSHGCHTTIVGIMLTIPNGLYLS